MKKEVICKPKDFKKVLDKLNQEKEYVFTFILASNKRTTRQNKYMWKLIQEIAKASYMSSYDVYLEALKKADAKSEYLITAYEMTEDLRKNFRGVEFIRYQEVNGKNCYVYKCYLGSSKMTTKEMQELIEILLDMASYVGLDLVYWKNIFYVR